MRLSSLKTVVLLRSIARAIDQYEQPLARRTAILSLSSLERCLYLFFITHKITHIPYALHFLIELRLININSFNEIERIKNIAQELQIQVNVGVRLCTSVGWADQFGLKIQSEEAFKAFEILSKIRCMNIEGIHVHLGSGIKNTLIYKKAIQDTVEFMNKIKEKLGIRVKYLDLGGGFGVATTKTFGRLESKFDRFLNMPYAPPKLENTPTINEFATEIVTTLQQECNRYKLPLPVLLFEPGRIITSNTQILLAKVNDLKEGDNKPKIAILDASINITYPLTWEYHEIFVANKMNPVCGEFYKIVGPVCSPADLLYKRKKLSLLEVGDIIAIMDTGAYFTSFSNNFSFPRPAVVMVSKGQHCILRKREDYADMVCLDKLFLE